MTNEELVEKIQTGIDVTENMYQLYEQNSGMIYKIAKKYTYAEDISDLFKNPIWHSIRQQSSTKRILEHHSLHTWLLV